MTVGAEPLCRASGHNGRRVVWASHQRCGRMIKVGHLAMARGDPDVRRVLESLRSGTAQSLGLLGIVSLFAITLLPSPGTGDVLTWVDWVEGAFRNGYIENYRVLHDVYPPGAQFLLYASSWFAGEEWIFESIKWLQLVSLLLMGLIYAAWLRRIDAATLAIAAFAVSSVGLGYLDVTSGVFLVAAFWMLQRERLALFGLLFAMSSLVKWQPLILLPVLAVYLWRVAGPRNPRAVIRRFLTAGAPALAAVAVAVGLFGYSPVNIGTNPVYLSLFGTVGADVIFLSGNALNLAWLAGAASRFPEHGLADNRFLYTTDVSSLVPLVLQLLLVTAALGVLVWLWIRGRSFNDLLNASIVFCLAYFVLGVNVHENHLFTAALCAVAGCYLMPGRRATYLIVISMFVVNLMVFYGVTGENSLRSNVLGIDATNILALLFLALAALVATRLLQADSMGRRPSESANPAVAESPAVR